MSTLGKYVRPYEAVTIVRNKQGNEAFDLNDLSRLVKHKVLNVYVEFVSPESSSVMFFDGEMENEEDFDTKFNYKKVAERAIHNPVDADIYLSNADSYNLEKSVDDELQEKGFFKYFSKSDKSNKLSLMPYQLHLIEYRKYNNAWWLINRKELQDYLDSRKNKSKKTFKSSKASSSKSQQSKPIPNWSALGKNCGDLGKVLVSAWRIGWEKEELPKDQPPTLEAIIELIREYPDDNRFQGYSIEQYENTFKIKHYHKKRKSIVQSWKDILKKYKKINWGVLEILCQFYNQHLRT